MLKNYRHEMYFRPSFLLNFLVLLQVVQEYERAVVFRLGRLRSGGAKGPGLFFIMPCVDSYKKVDLRTVSFDVPPQEVMLLQLCNGLSWLDQFYINP